MLRNNHTHTFSLARSLYFLSLRTTVQKVCGKFGNMRSVYMDACTFVVCVCVRTSVYVKWVRVYLCTRNREAIVTVKTRNRLLFFNYSILPTKKHTPSPTTRLLDTERLNTMCINKYIDTSSLRCAPTFTRNQTNTLYTLANTCAIRPDSLSFVFSVVYAIVCCSFASISVPNVNFKLLNSHHCVCLCFHSFIFRSIAASLCSCYRAVPAKKDLTSGYLWTDSYSDTLYIHSFYLHSLNAVI